MNSWLIDGTGLLGAALVVLAYCMLQLERLDPRGLAYNVINLVGAAGLVFSLCFNFNLASFIIEIFWIAASLLGLFKLWQRRNGEQQPGTEG
ncbi:MAG: hypothetical protein H6985_04040 [Pseudomonadales bacterium]|nr:hypothetical protein [Halioglobus sp.]MCP5128737.1 hypothetical protein [Pseudomonadales bacterium]